MIELDNITKTFTINNKEYFALKNINLKIYEGDFVGILGRSGSGKSTLVSLIGLLDNNYQGEYNFFNENLHSYTDNELSIIRNSKIGFIFQNFALIDSMTVYQNVELPLLYSNDPKNVIEQKVMRALKNVKLDEFENQTVRLLSGGQRQRVAIARAIVNSPIFLIADEPTGSLDSNTSKEIMEIFKELNDKGVTVIFVTHDTELIQYCSRIIYLVDGEIDNEI